MADRYLIENREAAVGVQVLFHMRQRWGGALRCGGRKRRSPFATGFSPPNQGLCFGGSFCY
jgi:hypothetical protein